MKFKNIVTVFVVAFILMSCAPAAKVAPTEIFVPRLTNTPVPPLPTITPMPIPSSTLSINSYPPCYPSFASSTPEYVSTPTLQLELSNGLILREYQNGAGIQRQESGCRYDTRHVGLETIEINLNNLFQVIVNPINDRNEKIVVMHNNDKIFETDAYSYIYSGLLAAWEYDNHWVIEVQAHTNISRHTEGIDIIRDGVSLKKTNDYKDVFAFQLLDKKPLYFFIRQNDTFGINYNDIETQLNYDFVPYLDFHPGADGQIEQYQNMVLFSTSKEGISLYVAIGAFNK